MSTRSSAIRLGLIAICLASVALVTPGCNTAATKSEIAASRPSAALRQNMRKLWEDHITWTRLVIVSTAANLPDLEPTTNRLLQNQADIGDAIRGYYGDEAATKLTTLLRDHIIGAAAVLAAAKGKNPTQLESAKAAWYSNGEAIAAFLSAANPESWQLADMQNMMKEHLDLTLAEAVAQLQGQYAESVAAYDRVHDAMMSMSDMLSDGIIKQFPDKF